MLTQVKHRVRRKGRAATGWLSDSCLPFISLPLLALAHCRVDSSWSNSWSNSANSNGGVLAAIAAFLLPCQSPLQVQAHLVGIWRIQGPEQRSYSPDESNAGYSTLLASTAFLRLCLLPPTVHLRLGLL